ncbi:MAG: succinate dehydrogenase assembly factor 2 [Deltaproteobacteria bacterium]|nr:succinate dehydrogenase assembly factor 2 [Deltaproteobacteria bacterium]
MRVARWVMVGLVVVGSACGDDDGASTDRDATTTPPPSDLGAGDPDGATPDAGAILDAGPEPPPWPRSGMPTSELGDRRGRRLARAIIHAHSVWSHDACDGDPQPDGGINEPCLADFRRMTCEAQIDVVMLTEHDAHMGDGTFEDVVSLRDGDERVEDADGNLVGKRLVCADGRRVLVTMGAENDLMPIGLLRHPTDEVGAPLHDAYNARSAAAADVFRAAGALVWQAHSEQWTADQVRESGLDGMEIYNLHANVGPDIREEFLGLDPLAPAEDLLMFASTRRGRLEPDLAFLTFFDENRPSLQRYDELVAEGMRIAGSAGTDCHQNVFQLELPDGERGDSYRRMMRWFGNYVLIDGEPTHESVREALAARRLFIGFDAMGTPVGFDYVAESPSGETFEMGDTAPVGSRLVVTTPTLGLGGIEDALAPPTIRTRILRAAATGAVEVVSDTSDEVEWVATEPGAYRVEVRIVPEHVRPYIARIADRLVREHVWVYSNPIWVE